MRFLKVWKFKRLNAIPKEKHSIQNITYKAGILINIILAYARKRDIVNTSILQITIIR